MAMGFQQKEIKIISEPSRDKPFIVIYKPKGIPSAPLTPEDTNNAFYQASKLYSELLNVQGRKPVEHGLLHRIDTETDGLLLIALSQDFYDYMMEEQKKGHFIKKYRAHCKKTPLNTEKLDGFCHLDQDVTSKILDNTFSLTVKSYFRNYGPGLKEVRPVTENSGKAALKKLGKKTEYETIISIKKIGTKYFADCTISSGYRHQVRCHLAWIGFPIIGDKLYNYEEKFSDLSNQLEFTAYCFSFINPYTRKTEIFSID